MRSGRDAIRAMWQLEERFRKQGNVQIMQDGVYKLTWGLANQAGGRRGVALAVVRNGEVLGSDPAGGVFAGRIREDRDADCWNVELGLVVPPDGTSEGLVESSGEWLPVRAVVRPLGTYGVVMERANEPIVLEYIGSLAA